MLKRKPLLIAVLLLLSIGSYLFFERKFKPVPEISFVTALVDRGDIISFVTANGTLKPKREVEIYSELNGVIKSVFCDINDSVKKGDLLAVIEPNQFENRLKEAQAKYNKSDAELKLNKSIFNSDKILYEKDLISKQQYESSQTRYKNALALFQEAYANMESASQNLERTKIISPIDGTIMIRNVNAGQIVKSLADDKPMLTIASDLKKIDLVIRVSEADIGKTIKGLPVKFKVSAHDETFNAEIIKMSNSPNKDKDIVTYDVTAEMDNSELKLKPGMTAEVRVIISEKSDTLRVPTSALRFIPSKPRVIKDDADGKLSVWAKGVNGKFVEIPVEVGISNEEFSEILNISLMEGQEIAIGSHYNETPKSVLTLPQPKRF